LNKTITKKLQFLGGKKSISNEAEQILMQQTYPIWIKKIYRLDRKLPDFKQKRKGLVVERRTQ